MSNFNLRNVPPDIMSLLKKEAGKKKISVNTLILQIIDKDLGITNPTKKIVYHDLDYLAGTWSDKDKKEFDQIVKSFDTIDEELWS